MKNSKLSLKAIAEERGWSTNNSITFSKPTKDYNYWIFYGMKDGVKIIHAIKNCKHPRRTKVYKDLSSLGLENVYSSVGYESAKYFNDYSEYIKFDMEM